MIERTAAQPPRNTSGLKPGTETATWVRYRILLLTFAVAFIMYLDRTCIGLVAPSIMKEFHLDKVTYGWSVSAFNAAYAMFQIPAGYLADRYGPRIVMTAALAWWSLFTAATGLSFNALSLAATRFLFGAGEAGAFPASSRAIAFWLPVEQRAFGQGFQHSGSRLGAALTPAIVVSLVVVWNWRSVFYIFGALGIACAVLWYNAYRDSPSQHRGVNAAELEILNKATVIALRTAGVPWRRILHSRNVWLLSIMYLCYGWVLWMYLSWFPTYLAEVRGYTQMKIGIGASLPLFAATLTNVFGGWISDQLTRFWGDRRKGRLVVLISGFAIAAAALIPGVLSTSPARSMVFLTIALAGLELTVPISWAISLDIGGKFSGSVSALMNTLGNVGGTLGSLGVAYLVTQFGWSVPFLAASGFCITAALLGTCIDPTRSIVGEHE